jgi:hypothetical protein
VDREAILNLLHSHQQDFQKLGIRSLSLFGSVARGDAGPESDIDFLIELDPPLTFDRYIEAKFYLEDLLGRPVDLVMPETLKPRVRPFAEREAIRVT